MNQSTAETLPEVGAVRHSSRQMVRELGFMEPTFEGLPYTECHVLGELARRGVLTSGDLAEILCLDKSTTSRVLARLRKRGLVQATSDEDDRRRKPLTLTPSGREAVRRLDGFADAQVDEALRLLRPADREKVVHGLALYARALNRARMRRDFELRPITAADDPVVARIIRTVLPEYGLDGPGSAFADPEVDAMTAAYAGPRAGFWVITRAGRVVGCGGFGPLQGGDEDTCELRKFYFLPAARGFGVGRQLLGLVLAAAREAGYTRCYLETMQHMTRARRLYESAGFRQLDAPEGDTGHCACNCWYLLTMDGEAQPA